MFRGYASNGFHKEVLVLFKGMKGLDIMPNCYTFPIVLKACMNVNGVAEGGQVHCFVIKGGFRANHFVGTMLIEMYSGWRFVGEAYKVFGETVERNVVVWTLMIKGFVSNRDIVSARRLFELAPDRDIVLWNIMVSGYIELGDMVEARKLFVKMPNKDVMSWNTMLNGYGNNGDMEACKMLFEEMPEHNVFSWNSLIGGYAHNKCFSEVLDTFKRMLLAGKVTANDATLVTVLSACTKLGALELGKWVHAYAENHGYRHNIYIGNALIDMYAKCGMIDSALDVFNHMNERDLISWNTIIGGLAAHGRGAEALSVFSQMKDSGEKPDIITFVGILCACTHLGLVKEGYSYFHSMIEDYSITPHIEHYGCMVDLLARAGFLNQAMDFIKKMPMKPDAVIWAALLGACRVHKNIELAEVALERLNEFEPDNPGNYVILSNIYSEFGRWKDVARLKVAMRDTGFKKIPASSLIEVDDRVVEFYSLDERHSETEQIYTTLKGLSKLLKLSKHLPDCQELAIES
ncbi:hypothetical protein ACFE04_031341 [Oxalis oulophora]